MAHNLSEEYKKLSGYYKPSTAAELFFDTSSLKSKKRREKERDTQSSHLGLYLFGDGQTNVEEVPEPKKEYEEDPSYFPVRSNSQAFLRVQALSSGSSTPSSPSIEKSAETPKAKWRAVLTSMPARRNRSIRFLSEPLFESFKSCMLLFKEYDLEREPQFGTFGRLQLIQP